MPLPSLSLVSPLFPSSLLHQGCCACGSLLPHHLDWSQGKVLHTQGGEAAAQAAQRGGGAPSLQTAEVRERGALSTAGAVGVPAQSRQWQQTAFKVPSDAKDSVMIL